MATANSQSTTTRRLVETAIMLALATVLSMVKLFHMPLGGSVTLASMLPICLIGARYGFKWALGTSFAYGVVQGALSFADVASWGIPGWKIAACIALDYVLAYTALAFAGAFKKDGINGMLVGTVFAIMLRFVFHVLSGALLFAEWMPDNFDNAWLYSISYNSAFLLPEMAITLIAAFLVTRAAPIRKLLLGTT
ncbi:MAG: energy-coupled thiamine transporter ThiT [Oscillospiraceae bacterium]|jgi:thiamine transporter|nr:energy-coupled thiamine transporter ThiT [Oscillospiraceae bacterium]